MPSITAGARQVRVCGSQWDSRTHGRSRHGRQRQRQKTQKKILLWVIFSLGDFKTGPCRRHLHSETYFLSACWLRKERGTADATGGRAACTAVSWQLWELSPSLLRGRGTWGSTDDGNAKETTEIPDAELKVLLFL